MLYIYVYGYDELKYNESIARAHLLCPMNELPFSLYMYIHMVIVRVIERLTSLS